MRTCLSAMFCGVMTVTDEPTLSASTPSAPRVAVTMTSDTGVPSSAAQGRVCEEKRREAGAGEVVSGHEKPPASAS
jgi:hypothetical protein